MIFAEPWLLLAFLVLPLLWWLLRASPPAPRTQSFPALRLLANLEETAESPERTPAWLMALRILALACLILGLANPVLNPRRQLAGGGPLLVVLDNGWAAAGDWADRTATARAAIQAAERQDRPVALLTTAAEIDGRLPAIQGPMAARDAQSLLAAAMPQPWAPDRAADRRALDGWHHPASSVLFIDDGITAPSGEAAFRAALAQAGQVTDARAIGTAALLPAPQERDGGLVIRLAAVPQPVARHFALLAEGSDGRTLSRIALPLPAGQTEASAPLGLPTMLANTVTKLSLVGAPSAGATLLLDRQWRHRIVGLASTAGTSTADAPLVGPLFYLNRALGPDVEIRRGGLMDLLGQPLSVLILSDRPLTAPDEVAAVTRFVRQGGLLIRFGGVLTGETADTLLPVHLLQQDRSLGGALSWNRPEPLAPFPATSPFAGLAVPKDVTVTRQLLADPASLTGVNVWATLADGTPLVSSARLGQGRIVLFHVTADADWSSLPLSGLFPDMLDRLIHLAAGTGNGDPKARLAPFSVMNGFGEMNPPSAAASPIEADQLASTQPSPKAPPGLYGVAGDRHALNLGPSLPAPTAAELVPGATRAGLSGRLAERDLGPYLTALAIALLILDLLASLALRGALRWHRQGSAALALAVAIGLTASLPAWAANVPQAALQTSLGYVVTGNGSVDRLSRDGLASLSDFVSSRSAAVLGPPVGVVPGRDDLSLYPLLYWPILPGSAAPTVAATAALNQFMANGGIILIDTQGSDTGAAGTGSGLQPGAAQALRQAVGGLDIPPLTPLSPHHVLAHTFYLLRDFPGRYDGAPIWVTETPEASNDGVSPIIIGANDWAAAWDMNQDGSFPYSTIPGSEQQRLYAYRFGMNLVMYALTGTYKGDQVHVPAILERLGQ
ncbi:DUF4159 domain-containing protein [Acidisoma silvae]|uniref:DUF4159 domain-containing protein n=1 Tax=Acidisoma silvae TaxID=2802396 RepID=A0A963YSL4_9PROT|nr:DUF4159 domain-containing protein [Acidisoma silvae]MCB8875618.1 DUF4159 domain-containing protein [Acidisoma silvae]